MAAPFGIDAFIDPSATVHPTAKIGDGTKVWGCTIIGAGAVIGPGCTIGRCVEIGPGVEIGPLCKVEAGAQIHAGWKIGSCVFVGPGAVFCNDNHPTAVRPPDKPFVPTRGEVKDKAVICANATIIAGLTLGARCKVWPGALAKHDIPDDWVQCTPQGELRPKPKKKGETVDE